MTNVPFAAWSESTASAHAMSLLQALVEEMSMLMKCVALHNAPLLHQHSCRRMDSGALNARDQLPPAGFYAKILVRIHRLKACFVSSTAVQRSPAKESQQVSVTLSSSTVVMPGYRTPAVAFSCAISILTI